MLKFLKSPFCALVKIIRSPSAEADVIGMDGNLDDTIHLILEDIAVLAEPAFAAVGLDIDRHPVSRLYLMDLIPYLGHKANHLVADGDSGNGTWHAAVLDVQVAGADARQGDLHNGILRVENPRLRLLL